MAGELGLRVADLADRGAEAAEFLRHGQPQVAVGPHGVVGLADERGVAVVLGGVRRGDGADLGRQATNRSSPGRTRGVGNVAAGARVAGAGSCVLDAISAFHVVCDDRTTVAVARG